MGFLAGALRRFVGDDNGALPALLDELLSTAQDRSFDPQPLDAAVLAQLLAKKRSGGA